MTALSHYPRLIDYARSLCKDTEQAKDLVQTAYEQYYKYKYSGVTVLYRTIRHRYYNELNHWKSKAMPLDAILEPITHDLDLYDAAYNQRRINSLGVSAEAVQMFLDGYSYKEIADKENVGINTVKSRIYQGKKKLGV